MDPHHPSPRQVIMIYQGYDPVSLGLSVRHSVGLNEVLCECPWHGGSDSLCVNLQTGAFICYSCGVRGGPGKLIKKTGGTASWTSFERPSPSEQDHEWRKLLDGDLAYDHPYLVSRGVDNWQVEKHSIRQCRLGLAFPMYDRVGHTTGALIRRADPKSKYRYVTLGGKPPVWPLQALDEVKPNYPMPVVEGVFGVLSAERAGYKAVAVLGARVKDQVKVWLSGVRPHVVFDCDLAGYLGAYKMLELLPMAKVSLKGREADELTPDEWCELMNDPGEFATNRTRVAEAAAYYLDCRIDEFLDQVPGYRKPGDNWNSHTYIKPDGTVMHKSTRRR